MGNKVYLRCASLHATTEATIAPVKLNVRPDMTSEHTVLIHLVVLHATGNPSRAKDIDPAAGERGNICLLAFPNLGPLTDDGVQLPNFSTPNGRLPRDQRLHVCK
jgi:hypothetical protein